MAPHTAEMEAIRAALREREERYQFLAETVPVQIWTALPDGQLDYVTAQTASHFGRSVEELLRDGWRNVVHPDDLTLAVERWTRALSTGETYEVEFRLLLASGEYAYHLARAVPQRDPSGATLRWFGTNTDIQAQIDERTRIERLLAEVERQSRETEAAIQALREDNRRLESELAAHAHRP